MTIFFYFDTLFLETALDLQKEKNWSPKADLDKLKTAFSQRCGEIKRDYEHDSSLKEYFVTSYSKSSDKSKIFVFVKFYIFSFL